MQDNEESKLNIGERLVLGILGTLVLSFGIWCYSTGKSPDYDRIRGLFYYRGNAAKVFSASYISLAALFYTPIFTSSRPSIGKKFALLFLAGFIVLRVLGSFYKYVF